MATLERGDAQERNGEGMMGGHLWAMGAVTRRTGITEHTLRAWERRFGFPKPTRLPSGHRRFPADQVRRLILIARALELGHRAGDVVPLPIDRLESLLRAHGAPDAAPGKRTKSEWLTPILDAARLYDRDTVAHLLHRDAVILGVARFLRERVAPLLDEIGEAWANGDLEIRHEHFISQVVTDLLRSQRFAMEASGAGRPVIFATLPEEPHCLGLEMAALCVVTAGRSVRMLGAQLPPEEIVEAAGVMDASAVALSVSIYSVDDTTRKLVAGLRDRLGERIELWVGGGGAAELENLPEGVTVLKTLDELDETVRQLQS